MNVDIDYPAQARVKRTTTDVKMFESWSAGDRAAFVCPSNKREPNGSKTIPAGYCANENRNSLDPATGPSR